MRRWYRTLLVCVLLLPTAVASARTQGADIDKTGWWQRAKTGGLDVPAPPGIPDGDLVVASANSGVSMISAVGIQPAFPEGSTIERFTLTMREDDDAAGNQNTAAGAILACPITAFWAGGSNGAWEDRPSYDCSAGRARGVRERDGTWTFDLRGIGEVWFDPFGDVLPDGVALVADVDRASGPFEAVFLGVEHIDVILVATPPAEEGDDDAFVEAVPEDPKTDVGLATGGTPGGGASLFSPPAVAAPPTTVATPTVIAATAEPDPAEVAAATPSAPRADRRGQLIGNWSAGTFVGLAAILVCLTAMAFWFGPAGEPTRHVRQRGVSRALEAQLRTNQEAPRP